jgi:hypothetical protein
MDLETAARELQASLGLPAGVASVLTWTEGGLVRLVVWVDPAWRDRLPPLPRKFGGYRVKVEERPRILISI